MSSERAKPVSLSFRGLFIGIVITGVIFGSVMIWLDMRRKNVAREIASIVIELRPKVESASWRDLPRVLAGQTNHLAIIEAGKERYSKIVEFDKNYNNYWPDKVFLQDKKDPMIIYCLEFAKDQEDVVVKASAFVMQVDVKLESENTSEKESSE